MLDERRIDTRMPLQIFLNEYLDDTPQRCMTLNLGIGGLYLNRLAMAEHRRGSCSPTLDSRIGLEFELPNTSETIWATGQICYDATDQYFHGTGVRFDRMAAMHRRLVRDYVLDYQEQLLHKLLARAKRRQHRHSFSLAPC